MLVLRMVRKEGTRQDGPPQTLQLQAAQIKGHVPREPVAGVVSLALDQHLSKRDPEPPTVGVGGTERPRGPPKSDWDLHTTRVSP